MTEGYIGITNDPKGRLQGHKDKAEWFDDRCVMTILQDGLTRQEARTIERILRPRPNIGWNKAVGGGDPPTGHVGWRPYGNDFKKGKKDSALTRARKAKNNGRYKRPAVSCVKCRKEMTYPQGLTWHLPACKDK